MKEGIVINTVLFIIVLSFGLKTVLGYHEVSFFLQRKSDEHSDL